MLLASNCVLVLPAAIEYGFLSGWATAFIISGDGTRASDVVSLYIRSSYKVLLGLLGKSPLKVRNELHAALFVEARLSSGARPIAVRLRSFPSPLSRAVHHKASAPRAGSGDPVAAPEQGREGERKEELEEEIGSPPRQSA